MRKKYKNLTIFTITLLTNTERQKNSIEKLIRENMEELGQDLSEMQYVKNCKMSFSLLDHNGKIYGRY